MPSPEGSDYRMPSSEGSEARKPSPEGSDCRMPSPEGEGGPPLVVDEVLQKDSCHHLIEEINKSFNF